MILENSVRSQSIDWLFHALSYFTTGALSGGKPSRPSSMTLRHRTLVKRLGRRQSKKWRQMLLPRCVLFTSIGIAMGAWTGTAFGSTVCSSLVLVDKFR
jgi:hypothetical protein